MDYFSENMHEISEQNEKAKAAHMTYGIYTAMLYEQSDRQSKPSSTPNKKKRRIHRKYTDEAVFELWQSGLSDTEIADKLGVSRQVVNTWRTEKELPSSKIMRETGRDPHQFKIIKDKDGNIFIIDLE